MHIVTSAKIASMSKAVSRVLIVSPRASQMGHYWPNTVALANTLSNVGVSADIIAPGRDRSSDLDPAIHVNSLFHISRMGRLLLRFSWCRQLLSAWDILSSWLEAYRLWYTGLYDCVHFIDGKNLAACCMVLSSNCTVINSVYGFPSIHLGSWHSPIVAMAFRFRAILLSRAISTGRFAVVVETNAISDAYHPVFGEHVHCVPYSILAPVLLTEKIEARKTLGLPQDRFIFLLFGTHRKGKDYRTVLKALTKIDDNAIAFFSGALISDNDPHVLAEELAPKRSAFLDGFVTELEMAYCFCASDFVVIPYEAGFERGSGVLLEACRYFCPVIATDTGYLRDFVQENDVGFLYEPGNVDLLAKRMKEAMKPESIKKFAQGLEMTAHQYSWTVTIQNYLAIYNKYTGTGHR